MIPIPAEYYSLVYILIVTLVGIPVCLRYYNYSTDRLYYAEKEPIVKSLLFTIFIILFVGLRPNSPVFADGPGYWAGILDHRWEGGSLEDVNYQFMTKWLMSFMSYYGFHPQLGFVVLASVIYGGAFIAMRKMFPRDTFIAMILFCGAFCTFGGAVNGIKNGMACSMFLCALAYRDNWKVCLVFLLTALGFHHSMQISIAAFIVCLFYKNTKVYYFAWFASLAMAILHISFFQTLFAGFTDDHAAEYLLTDEYSWVSGFRLDFVLYSAAPLALHWWVIYRHGVLDRKLNFLTNVYLVMNSVWLLCMYASYTNRFASLSWSLFPLLILYPLLNERVNTNQHKVLVWFIVGQLSFTLLMDILTVIQRSTN